MCVAGASVLLFSLGANASVEGTASLDKLRYRITDVPTLTVIDADLNTSTLTRQTTLATLSSTSDTTGINVTLQESGTNSATFTKEVSFTTGASNDVTDTLKVAAGDTLTLRYSDAAPSGTRTATATMYADNGTAGFTAVRYALDDTATLRVTDADVNTSPGSAQTLSVDLESTTDTSGISVTLTETSANSSIFEGAATFTDSGSSNNGSDILEIGAGDTLTVIYTEDLFDGASTATRTGNAVIQQNGTASLNALRYALTDTATLTVTDPDLNTSPGSTQTGSVNFKSTTDATGVSVTVTETGVNTGIFTGSATFVASGSSSGSVLRVSAGDVLTLTYAETTTYEGPDQNRTDTGTMRTTGSAAFAALRYDLNDTATLSVTDLDLNADPASAESTSVNVKSTIDATGFSVTLTETGLDTGVFTNTITFNEVVSNAALRSLRVAAGNTLTLTYTETTTFNEPTTNRTATATMYADTATASFNADGYALDDTATLTVNDADINSSVTTAQSLSVDLTSTTDLTGISVTLTETGVNTGIFAGTATFVGTGSSNNASDILRVGTGDTVTLTYTEPLFNGVATLNRTDTATMRQDGSASLSALRYDLNDTATLTVTDPDLNTSSGSAQTAPATITSTTDPTGLTVSLTETGANTGIFTRTVTFTTSGSSAGTTLLVSQGDTITLTYAETTTYSGTDVNRTATATIFTDTATASLSSTRFSFADTATLTVTDADANTATGSAQTVTVNLKSTADAAGISVTLTETGNNTSTFTGSATFSSSGVSSDPADILRANQGDTITLTYAEPNASGTGTTARTATATMLKDDNAVVSLDALRYTTGAIPTLTVAHPDANTSAGSAQSLTVSLKSTTDALGISVTLTESGANTGIFNSPDNAVEFVTTGTSTDATNTLRVTQGDTITLTYAEPNASGTGTTNRTATATIFADTATASLNGTRYDFGDTATLTVADADRNTDASSAQSFSATFASQADATGVSVALTETGADTGTFTGTATFATSGLSNDTTDVLRADQGDTVTLTYAEPNASGSGTTPRSDTATMLADTATVTFNKAAYDLDDVATVTVTDADANLDAGSADSVTVAVFSTSDGTGFSISATETGVNTGVFSNTISFTTGASISDTRTLKVASGNTVTGRYAEPNASGSGTTNRTGTTKMFTDGATVAFDAARYGVTDDPAITVTDADQNSNASLAQSVSVTFSSTSDGAGISVTLTETGANTGIFVGTAGLRTGASTATELKVAEGDLLTATYAEPDFDAVGTTDRTANAETKQEGSVSLDADTYDPSDTVTMTVTDLDLNTNSAGAQSVSVSLESTTDPTGISVTLTETGTNTGVFSGTATLEDTGSSDDPSDVLLVSGRDDVTVTYAETSTFSGTPADRTDSAEVLVDGSIALDASRYELNDIATLTVTDANLDTDDGSPQTISVGFVGDADPSGISVTLTETGDDTGVFAGTATFIDSGLSNNGTDVLRVDRGDAVTATYVETIGGGVTTDRTATATIFADTATAALDSLRYAQGSTATLTVADADRDTSAASAQSVTVGLASTSDGAGISVTLNETGDDTGVFTGTATFDPEGSDDPSDRLDAAEGDVVTMTYDEPNASGAGTTSRTGTATMYVDTATVALDQSIYDADDIATLTVADVDRNTDAASPQTATTTLVSSTDPAGITVVLDETGDDTGVFTGTATFTTDGSDDDSDVLQVAQGATLTASYSEPLFDGTQETWTDGAVLEQDGSISLDAASYAAGDTATITVEDVDGNASSVTIESVEVTLSSDSDPTGITLTLNETGANKGIFAGAAALTSDPSSASTLQVAEGDEVMATYTETTPMDTSWETLRSSR